MSAFEQPYPVVRDVLRPTVFYQSPRPFRVRQTDSVIKFVCNNNVFFYGFRPLVTYSVLVVCPARSKKFRCKRQDFSLFFVMGDFPDLPALFASFYIIAHYFLLGKRFSHICAMLFCTIFKRNFVQTAEKFWQMKNYGLLNCIIYKSVLKSKHGK